MHNVCSFRCGHFPTFRFQVARHRRSYLHQVYKLIALNITWISGTIGNDQSLPLVFSQAKLIMANDIQGHKSHLRHHYVAHRLQAVLVKWLSGCREPGLQGRFRIGVPILLGPFLKFWVGNQRCRVLPQRWICNDLSMTRQPVFTACGILMTGSMFYMLYNKCKPQKSHLEELESPATQQEESALPPYLNSHWLNHWTNRSQLGMASVILHFEECWGPNRRTTHVAIDGGPVHVQLAMMSSLHDLTKNIKYQKAHKAPKIKKKHNEFFTNLWNDYVAESPAWGSPGLQPYPWLTRCPRSPRQWTSWVTFPNQKWN